jgi:PAS domain S-box-containing protein
MLLKSLKKQTFRWRTPNLALLIGTPLLVAITTFSLVSWFSLQQLRATKGEIRNNLSNLSWTLTHNVEDLFHATDLGVYAIIDEIALERSRGPLENARLEEVIHREERRQSEVFAFRIFGPNGILKHGTSNAADVNGDVSRQDDFVYMRDHQDCDFRISEPQIGPVTGQWIIVSARRLSNVDGSFDGQAVGIIRGDVFEGMFSRVKLGPSALVALVHDNGTIAARYPAAHDVVGTRKVNDEVAGFLLSKQDTKYDENYVSPVDGRKRVAFLRRVSGAPYTVVVAISEDSYLYRWRQQRNYMFLFASLASAMAIAAMAILHRGIRAQHATTSRLVESEAKLRGLFEMSPLGIIRIDRAGRYVEVNKAFCDIVKRTESELLGTSYLAVTADPPKLEEDERWATIDEKGCYGPILKNYVRPDGTIVAASTRGMAVFDRHGNEGIWSIIEDVTERLEQERQLEMRRVLVDYVEDCVYIVDPAQNHRFILANEATCRHFGKTEKELLDATIYDVVLDIEGSVERYRELVRAKKKSSFEMVSKTPRGLVTVAVSANFLSIDGREMVGGYFRDITSQAAVEKAMRERAEQLTRSNADLEQFAYAASHDLQAPLRNILSFARTLEGNKAEIGEQAARIVGHLVAEARHMSQLILDLLEYSSVANSKNPPSPVESADAVALALKQIGERVADAEVEVADGLPLVMAEMPHLVRLFQNLVGNALKFRHPDRPPRIAVSAEMVSPSRWRFAVADNGIGIGKEHHEDIFQMFKRLPPYDSVGTGVGLAMARRIVVRFGGKIWVESEPGAGATFFFTLHAAPEED